MIRTNALFAISSALCLALASLDSAHAVTLSITSHPADFEPRFQTNTSSFAPGPSVTADRLRVGFQVNFQLNGAYFFQLPAFGPGTPILGADFSVTALPDASAAAAVPTHNTDLVAVGITTPPPSSPPANGAAESQAYFFLGEGATDAGVGRQLIQNNFLAAADFVPSTGVAGLKSTDPLGDAALVAYLNGLYLNQATNGFVPGQSYLVLRLNPDQASGAGTNRYSLASADNISGVQLPTLTLTAIPEPATAWVVACGLAVLAFVRRALHRGQ